MCKSKLFWLGALLQPKIVISRLEQFIVLLFAGIIFLACGIYGGLIFIGVLFAVALPISVIFPTACYELASSNSYKRLYVMVFHVDFTLLKRINPDKFKDFSIIRVIAADELGKCTVTVKALPVNEFQTFAVERRFFLACDEGNFWTAYGVEYPEGKLMGVPYPQLLQIYSATFAYGENGKIVINLFSEDDIISLSCDEAICSFGTGGFIKIDHSYSVFSPINDPKSASELDDTPCNKYILIKDDNKYKLFAYVRFCNCYKVYSVRAPRISVRYNNKYRELVYDKTKGYKMLNF
jgi:hypothetical protein